MLSRHLEACGGSVRGISLDHRSELGHHKSGGFKMKPSQLADHSYRGFTPTNLISKGLEFRLIRLNPGSSAAESQIGICFDVGCSKLGMQVRISAHF